jgi:hypothetical protein
LTSQETETGVPLSCTIQITGSKAGTEVASQTATFTANGLTPPMTKVTLNSAFKNVDSVVFKTQGLLSSTLAAVLMDNLEYNVYLKKGKSLS